jgi:riboflavin synthase
MFTGLVQHVGRVVERTPTDRGVRLVVDAAGWQHAWAAGDSVAVNGVCLTAVDGRGEGPDNGPGGSDARLAFDMVGETLRASTLGGLGEGMGVNLEHAARMDTLMGGHLVQGHVDCVGEVLTVQADPEDWRVRIAPGEVIAGWAAESGPQATPMDLIVPKGSITVEGVSLTVAAVGEEADGREWFEIALIPTTLAETTLEALSPGDRVNIETDMLARQVVHVLGRWQRGGRG